MCGPHKSIAETEAVLKGEEEPIGSIGIVRLDQKSKSVHLGYCIGPKWWNRGIAIEAVKRSIDFFFQEVKVNRIDSNHDP